MFTKLKEKIKIIFKKKDTKKEQYKNLKNRIEYKIKKLEGKKDENSFKERLLYHTMISKLEKKSQR